jgi:hypothetical protein
LEDRDLSNESQAREIIDSFPIEKATVDDIEIEYKILKPKTLTAVMRIRPSFSLLDYE